MNNENNYDFSSENNPNTFNYSNENSFKKSNYKIKSNSGFGKTVVVPFISGILGATLVIGTCFGVPSIKSKLLGSNTKKNEGIPIANKSIIINWLVEIG